MFNQKVNHYTSENPSYLNHSISAPRVTPLDIHNCGTTINKYNKISNCGSLPLQTWCSKNVAVESFGMRPIVNSKNYFSNIKEYLQSIIINDFQELQKSKLASEKYVQEKNGTIFRLGTVFGLGDTYSRLRMDLVVNVLTMKAIKDGEITINGGEQWRPIIAVKDIAEYVVEACKKKHQGIYVLAKENVLIRELGERIVDIIPNTKINYTEISFQDARNYKVDNGKSLDVFEYKPQVTVEEEVLRMVKMFKEGRVMNPEDKFYHNGAFLKNKQAVFPIKLTLYSGIPT